MTSAGFRTRFPDARLVLPFVLSKNAHQASLHPMIANTEGSRGHAKLRLIGVAIESSQWQLTPPVGRSRELARPSTVFGLQTLGLQCPDRNGIVGGRGLDVSRPCGHEVPLDRTCSGGTRLPAMRSRARRRRDHQAEEWRLRRHPHPILLARFRSNPRVSFAPGSPRS